MSSVKRHLGQATALAFALVLFLPTVATQTAPASTTALVDIRAAHYAGFDRIVFEFDGALPRLAGARWVDQPRLDPSHKLAHVQGDAFVEVWFRRAVAHAAEPPQAPTVRPLRRGLGLPNINHVVLLGDHEGQVSVGIGLMKRTRILKTFRLANPSRYVVDVATRFPKITVSVFFVDQQAVIDGRPPYVVPVRRRVPAVGRVEGALQRLYAGPTQAELDAGLRFVASKTYGFRDLWVNYRDIARVTLRGPCDSGGSAEVTVASQILPTLRSRPGIDWVKILDRHGGTQEPWGTSDSMPFCLEP